MHINGKCSELCGETNLTAAIEEKLDWNLELVYIDWSA